MKQFKINGALRQRVYMVQVQSGVSRALSQSKSVVEGEVEEEVIT